MNIRLFGEFRLLSPLSHISEAIGTTAYLVEDPIVQPDGTVTNVFCYSGNAWRGQLRDLAACYMIERLGAPRLSLDAFHLLFSGGAIGGEQGVDLEQSRRIRGLVPLVAVWGGGVRNQILPGKLIVENSYPVCAEAIPVLPPSYHARAEQVAYRDLTVEKSFTRRDDGKDDRYAAYLALPSAESMLSEPAAGTGDRRARRREAPAQQMRTTVELVVPGTCLVTEVRLLDVSEVELGCFVSALHRFSLAPYIGGQSGRGHGKVLLRYHYQDLDSGAEGPFVAVVPENPPLLAPPAEQAKAAYDQHLRRMYDDLLSGQADAILSVLGAARPGLSAPGAD